MDRISTLNLNQMSSGGALKVQTQWAKAEMQQSSGLVSQDFAGLGGDATSQTLSLEHSIAQAQTWSSEATTVGARTQAMYNAIGTMASLVTTLQTKIAAAMSSTDNSGLTAQVKSIQDSLISAMNMQVNGNYVFAGSNTDTAPVNLTSYPTTTTTAPGTIYNNQTGPNYYDPTVTDTSYYTGDTAVQSVQISSQQTVNYGVTGNDPAFEAAMRAVEAVAQTAAVVSTLTNAQRTAALGQALDVAGAALLKLSNLQATVAANASTLSTAAQQQTTYVTYLQNSLSSVKDVDAAQVASQVAAYQTQLTASYSAVSNVRKISLVQYL